MNTFESERKFEEHIRGVISTEIIPKSENLILFESKKAVDILICRNNENHALYFLEIKYHLHKHGRIGIGQGKGGGFQPEIIKKQPSYFEKNMRWILGSEEKTGYWFLKNSDISKNLSGTGIDKKFNNIRRDIFSKYPALTENELILELKNWLLK